MATIGRIVGSVQVGEEGSSPTINSNLVSTSPELTSQNSGIKVQAASVSLQSLALGMTRAVLAHLKFFDDVTGAQKKATIELNGNASLVLPPCTEFIYSTDDTTGGITGIKITTEAANNTRIEYAFAGV